MVEYLYSIPLAMVFDKPIKARVYTQFYVWNEEQSQIEVGLVVDELLIQFNAEIFDLFPAEYEAVQFQLFLNTMADTVATDRFKEAAKLGLHIQLMKTSHIELYNTVKEMRVYGGQLIIPLQDK